MHTGFTLGGWIKTAKNYIAETAWAIFKKEMIDYMTDELVNWIQGGGNPKFVTDWEGFLTEVADNAGGKVLEDLTSKEFMSGLCQPDWAIKIRIGLQKPQKFATKARCTISDVGVNFTDFMDNFNNGGWQGWLSVSESQNNPYGLYMLTLNEKIEKEARATLGAENEVKTGLGFLSDKVCRQITLDGIKAEGKWKMEDIPPTAYCSKVETRTPGKIVADGLNQSVFKDIEWLKNADGWQNMVVAVSTAVINRLTKEGVMAITSADSKNQDPPVGGPIPPNVKDYQDIVPPISTASVFDPWHISIKVNEAIIGIYYTLDGSNPTPFSPQYNNPISIISSTSLSAPLSPLKWLAIDKSFNEEDIRTLDIASPFSVPGLQAPVSVEAAVDSTSVTLLSNEPAVIYYTIDGTYPDTFSPKFTRQIDLNTNNATVIRWFAVDQDGNRESASHTLSTQPLFPNNELPYIVDLVAPTPFVSSPTTALPFNLFTLDPSSSVDDDITPQISMYEWDFDNDGLYDWRIIDYDRDGIFDEEGCRIGISCSNGLPIDQNGQYQGIGNGFISMTVPFGVAPGVVSVSYSSGQKDITVRVTDNEGLSTEASVIVNVQ